MAARIHRKKYGITNLWKYDLPNAWRIIYTIDTDEVRIMSIILEWFSHKDYDKRFKRGEFHHSPEWWFANKPLISCWNSCA